MLIQLLANKKYFQGLSNAKNVPTKRFNPIREMAWGTETTTAEGDCQKRKFPSALQNPEKPTEAMPVRAILLKHRSQLRKQPTNKGETDATSSSSKFTLLPILSRMNGSFQLNPVCF